MSSDLLQAGKIKRGPGPEPERLKIEGDWEEAMKRALGKKRPPEGWPRPPGKRKQAKDAK